MFLECVRQWISQHKLIASGDKVLTACSGGPDSLALLDVLHRLSGELDFVLAVAHVNHGLRGAESDADAEFVAAFSRSQGLPFFVGELELGSKGKPAGLSPEEAARVGRYEFLRRTADEWGGALIATGHHQDDQAETFLLHLLRGSGSRGLGGIRPAAGGIVRPLLGMSRADIEAYCKERLLQPRQDSSNFKTDFLRNSIRLELLPQLARTYNPSIARTLVRTAGILSDESDFIRQAASAAFRGVVNGDAPKFQILVERFAAEHPAVRRDILLQLLEKLKGDLKGIQSVHVEGLMALIIGGETGKQLSLPASIQAKKSYGTVVVGIFFAEKKTFPGSVELNFPGITRLDSWGIEIALSERPVLPVEEFSGRERAIFDRTGLTPPFFVRARQDGDRFQPFGVSGQQKLKQFLIDKKIPRDLREAIPLLCDQQGIIWVVGYRQTERGRISATTRNCIVMEVRTGEAEHYDERY